MEKDQPPEGEQDLIASFMSRTVQEAGAYIEAKMLEEMECSFQLEGKNYVLTLRPAPSAENRTFTLKDMLNIHKEGAYNANVFCGYPSELDGYLKETATEYFAQKFGITIKE